MILTDIVRDVFARGSDQLYGRNNGPLNLRLIITPTVSTILALRDGWKGARWGERSFLWDVLQHPPAKRKEIVHAVWKSLKKVILLAFTLDLIYQLYVFRAYYVFQTILLVLVLALIPYTVIRGLTTRITNAFLKGNNLL
jgi:hypothetical protein